MVREEKRDIVDLADLIKPSDMTQRDKDQRPDQGTHQGRQQRVPEARGLANNAFDPENDNGLDK